MSGRSSASLSTRRVRARWAYPDRLSTHPARPPGHRERNAHRPTGSTSMLETGISGRAELTDGADRRACQASPGGRCGQQTRKLEDISGHGRKHWPAGSHRHVRTSLLISWMRDHGRNRSVFAPGHLPHRRRAKRSPSAYAHVSSPCDIDKLQRIRYNRSEKREGTTYRA